jgi:tetratricopeptide (TPR) repeat protein
MTEEILQEINSQTGVLLSKLSNKELQLVTNHPFDLQYPQAYKLLGDYCYYSQDNKKASLEWYVKALKAGSKDVYNILRYFPLEECDDGQEDPMQYGKMFPGCMINITGAISSIVAIKMGVPFLVQSCAEQYPDLDWGNNLFLLACRKKHHHVIEKWESLTHQKLEYYGILYGYVNAHQNKDEVLMKWIQSHPTFQEEEIQSALQMRNLFIKE